MHRHRPNSLPHVVGSPPRLLSDFICMVVWIVWLYALGEAKNIDDFALLKVLGKGSYGKVMRCCVSGTETVAAKPQPKTELIRILGCAWS